MLKYSVSSADVKCRFLKESRKLDYIFSVYAAHHLSWKDFRAVGRVEETQNVHWDGQRLTVCSLGHWSLACEEWKQERRDVTKRGREERLQTEDVKKIEEGSTNF